MKVDVPKQAVTHPIKKLTQKKKHDHSSFNGSLLFQFDLEDFFVPLGQGATCGLQNFFW